MRFLTNNPAHLRNRKSNLSGLDLLCHLPRPKLKSWLIYHVYSECLKSELHTQFGFQTSQLFPIPRQSQFQTLSAIQAARLSEIRTKVILAYIFHQLRPFYKKLCPKFPNDLAQCVWILDSWDCWFCLDFGHNHATSTSEIQTLQIQMAFFGFLMFRFWTFGFQTFTVHTLIP